MNSKEPTRLAVTSANGPPSIPPEGEIASLTSIRGLAAIWVVGLHSYELFFDIAPEVSVARPLIAAGVFAVPLFFILSGYVLGLRYLTKLRSPSPRGLLQFWWLRLGRIYPVHFCTLLICLGMTSMHGWPKDPAHRFGDFVANCLLMHAWMPRFQLSWNYPSWSISSEWFAYLIFPGVAYVLSRARRTALLSVVVAAGVVSAAVYAFRDAVPFYGLAVVVPTFVGGVALALVCPPGGPGARVPFGAALGVLMSVLLPFLLVEGPMQSALYLVLFFVLVRELGLSGNRSNGFWGFPPLFFLGEVSYSLYLTHMITLTLLKRFLPLEALVGQPVWIRIAALLGCGIAILGATVTMYYSVERPMRGWSRRMGLAS